MKYQPGTINHLQKYIEHKIDEQGFSDESLHERMLLLTEEVGELAKACRKLTGMYINQTDQNEANPGEEVADVLLILFAVAIKLELDVEQQLLDKIDKTDQRIYARGDSKFDQ